MVPRQSTTNLSTLRAIDGHPESTELVVSIVIPCYNGRQLIEQTIRSVRAQTFAHWQLVVVDDGSTDGSADFVRELTADDPRIEVVAQANRGVAEARMAGVRAADPSAPYVIFLDQDDVWYPDALEVLVAHLEAHPEAPAVFGDEVTVDVHGAPFDDPPWPRERRFAKFDGDDRIVRVDSAEQFDIWDVAAAFLITTPGQCLLRRAKTLDDGCAFSSVYGGCCDWALWLEVADRGPIDHVDRPVVDYRRHEGTMSSAYENMRADRAVVYSEFEPRLRALDPTRFELAHAFGTYGNDAALCARWAVDNVRWRQPGPATVYAARSLWYSLRYYARRGRIAVARR